jgi:hypothetical protein
MDVSLFTLKKTLFVSNNSLFRDDLNYGQEPTERIFPGL